MTKKKNCGNCKYKPRDFTTKNKPCRVCWAVPRYSHWKPMKK